MIRDNNTVRGYIFAIIAAATYGMNPLFTLPLYADGMDANSVLFFRYLLAIPILAVMIKSRGRDFKIKRKEILPLAIMGIIMGYSSIGLFESYNYMEASIASTMLFIYPLMVALIMGMLFHERLAPYTLVCLIVAMGGIVLLYYGKPNRTLSIVGSIWVMSAALSYAIYLIGVNKSVLKDMAPVKLTFYVLLFGLSVYLVTALFKGYVTVPDTPWLWSNLIALAILPTAISLICTTLAVHDIGSTPTAIIGVFEPVTAIVFGVAVFGETLTGVDLMGIILIMIAVTLVIAGGAVVKPIIAVKKMLPKLHKSHKQQ